MITIIITLRTLLGALPNYFNLHLNTNKSWLSSTVTALNQRRCDTHIMISLLALLQYFDIGSQCSVFPTIKAFQSQGYSIYYIYIDQTVFIAEPQ